MLESEYHIPDILPPRMDFVFKRLFGDERNKDILCAFLKAVLKLPDGEFTDIRFLNTELKKEYIYDKHGILDVRVTTATGVQIDIEIQLHNKKDMVARSLYYWSKLYFQQPQEGDDYSSLCKTIAINILDYNMFTTEKYHSTYLLQEKENKALLTDLIQIDFLELPKVRRIDMDSKDMDNRDGNTRDDKFDWALFLASDNEEVFSMLADKNKDILKAYQVLQVISSDPATRAYYLNKEKAIRDYNAMVAFDKEEAKKEGMKQGLEQGIKKGIEKGREEERIKIVKSLLSLDYSADQIAEVTGLTLDEIREIKKGLRKS